MESYHKKKIGSIPKDSTGGSSIRKGMVVFNGGTSETGLVGDVTGNCVSVPVRMTAGRELVTDDAVMFLNDCREASAEQKIALQRLLNEGHLAWAGGENQVRELRICAYEYLQSVRQAISPLYETAGQ